VLVVHVILMDILSRHGGWSCVEMDGAQMFALDACLIRSRDRSGVPPVPLGCRYWMSIWSSLRGGVGRSPCWRPYDMKAFFAVVGKAPDEICPADVLDPLGREGNLTGPFAV
jgi:hypothetical protein